MCDVCELLCGDHSGVRQCVERLLWPWVETAESRREGQLLGGRTGLWDFFLSYSSEPWNCAQRRLLRAGLSTTVSLGKVLKETVHWAPVCWLFC